MALVSANWQDNSSKNLKIKVKTLFKDASSFKEAAEEITNPMKEALDSAFEIINKDPLMRVSASLKGLNTSVAEVYDSLTKEQSLTKKTLAKIPYLSQRFEKQTFTDTKIKLNEIFNWFDTAHQSIESSITLQKEYVKWINTNLEWLLQTQKGLRFNLLELNKKIDKDPNNKTLSTFKENILLFDNNLATLEWHLILTRKTIQIKLDSAEKLALTMSMSQPILSALMGNAIISNATQKTADACINIMSSMSTTLDNMSVDMTNKAIATSQIAMNLSVKPLLSSSVLTDNVKKIQEHFQLLDSKRATCLSEAEEVSNELKNNIAILWNIQQLQLK